MHGMFGVVTMLLFEFGSARVAVPSPLLKVSMVLDGCSVSFFTCGVGKLGAVFGGDSTKLLWSRLGGRLLG